MGTPAIVIVPTDSRPKAALTAIQVYGDGYPDCLGKDLVQNVRTLDEAQAFIRGGHRPYFSAKGNSHFDSFPAWTTKRLQDLIHSVDFVYRFNPLNNHWYLWVKHLGWVKLTERIPDPFDR